MVAKGVECIACGRVALGICAIIVCCGGSPVDLVVGCSFGAFQVAFLLLDGLTSLASCVSVWQMASWAKTCGERLGR